MPWFYNESILRRLQMTGNMDSELLLKFMGICQTTFRHCRLRFYAFYWTTFVETAVNTNEIPDELLPENMIPSRENNLLSSRVKTYIQIHRSFTMTWCFMAAWRYEISLLVLKNISYFSTIEDKFRRSAWPCNILYYTMNCVKLAL